MGGAFLFGKLPALGDFVCRNMIPAQREAWDARCIDAIADAHRRGDYEGLEATSPHGFLIAPSVDEPFWQIACVAPSCDRAGRHFLLVLGMAREAPWGEEWRTLAGRLEFCLRAAITWGLDAEAVLELIGETLVTDEPAPIKTFAGWRTDWLGASPATQERDD
ncbi:type VI secretion system-associated protein TagF [Sphingomonas sp. PR090111-T3T-6A]|uniref:type VI secretion system-associated protein TagF n=1 Tax=Sphingomonas sp. PR090111-T3T-6A TaxID=685778 RepID=UPI0003667F62|nr:type VI secretion system-associated protein TagF [Sphingomonas sp. PR090111-T3T-6A]